MENTFYTSEELEQRTKYINVLLSGFEKEKREFMLKNYEQSSTKYLIYSLDSMLDDILTYGSEEDIEYIHKILGIKKKYYSDSYPCPVEKHQVLMY